jgi:hypothetical protein
MISHSHFGTLRLSNFFPDNEIDQLENWEFLDHLWMGEAIGFSEWLRLEKEPDILRSLAIDFKGLPHSKVEEILRVIDLPIRAAMTIEELKTILGEPYETSHFVLDRVTCEFLFNEPHPYNLSCTALNIGGLVYLVITAPLNEFLSMTLSNNEDVESEL